jgi:FtsP/CotA-like multicopper oxidase with cupredoxin domain
LDGIVTDGGRLAADDSVLLTAKTPDRIHTMRLTGSMGKYDWSINGRRFNMEKPFAGAFEIKMNERVQVKMVNDTTMWPPCTCTCTDTASS